MVYYENIAVTILVFCFVQTALTDLFLEFIGAPYTAAGLYFLAADPGRGVDGPDFLAGSFTEGKNIMKWL